MACMHTCIYNIKHKCARNSIDSSFLCDSTLRRGCVIVHDPDCVLSHDRGTRLLRMNIVNILLNLTNLRATSRWFSVFHDCPSTTELATQWRDHLQRRDIHRKPSKSRQEINPHEKSGKIQARNLLRKFPTNLDMAWRILTHTGAS